MRLRFVEGLQNPSTSNVVAIAVAEALQCAIASVAALTRVVNDAVGSFIYFYLFSRAFNTLVVIFPYYD